jgi:hypothetical protein
MAEKWTVWSYDLADQEKRVGDDVPDVVRPARQVSWHRDFMRAEQGARKACSGGLMGGRNITAVRAPVGREIEQHWTIGAKRRHLKGGGIDVTAVGVTYTGEFIVKED